MAITLLGAIAFPTISTDGIKSAVVDTLQSWLATHPIIQWIVLHPLYAVGVGVAMLFLFWGLLQAIARFTEHIWLWILQAPIRLARWLVGTVIGLVRAKTTVVASEQPSLVEPRDRLEEILLQLDTLRHEQDALLQEAKAIVELEKRLVKNDTVA